MGTDLRGIIAAAAPRPTRPLDMAAVAARGRRLGYARAATVALMSTVVVGAVAYALVSDMFVAQRFATRPPSGPAGPTEGHGGGTIVIGAKLHGSGVLFTIDPADGTPHQTLLHPDSHHVEHPSWSPGGERIVFNAYLPGDEKSGAGLNSEIFVVDADGSRLERLTDDSEPLSSPEWSPDGDLIAFGRADDAASWEVYTMRSDGSDARLVSDRDTGADYTWSPNSRDLAFSEFLYRDGKELHAQEIFVQDVVDGTVERLTHVETRSSDPAWSPDGERIAFLCDDGTGLDICMMNADGSAAYELYETIPGEDPVDPDAGVAWSPDGSRLVFATRVRGSSQLMTVDPLGRDLRPLGPPHSVILGLDWDS
jgi:Tol biopolymer transport system component